MIIREEERAKWLVYFLEGRLDALTCVELETALSAGISNGGKNLIIDFEKLDYVSSAGLRVILSIAKKINNVHGKFVLCTMCNEVREVFDMTGFSNIVPIKATLDEAL
ncbi:MAG: STAS domain-containing protein [Aestuariibacter sp.]|nr:STAS domain-containing protein [Aestuariibacter sp.]